MDAIEAELESELAAIGNVVAHYDAADLGDASPRVKMIQTLSLC